MKIDLVATKAHQYGSRRLVAGDSFSAAGRDARLLVALGRATVATPAPTAPPVVLDAPAPQRRPRTYKRRDLTAQDSEAHAVPPALADVFPDPAAAVQSTADDDGPGGYASADLTAEE